MLWVHLAPYTTRNLQPTSTIRSVTCARTSLHDRHENGRRRLWHIVSPSEHAPLGLKRRGGWGALRMVVFHSLYDSLMLFDSRSLALRASALLPWETAVSWHVCSFKHSTSLAVVSLFRSTSSRSCGSATFLASQAHLPRAFAPPSKTSTISRSQPSDSTICHENITQLIRNISYRLRVIENNLTMTGVLGG